MSAWGSLEVTGGGEGGGGGLGGGGLGVLSQIFLKKECNLGQSGAF